MLEASILVKYNNIKLSNRNGPKGIKCSLLRTSNIRENGKAKALAKKMEITPKSGDRMRPKTNIILISPPPRLSF